MVKYFGLLRLYLINIICKYVLLVCLPVGRGGGGWTEPYLILFWGSKALPSPISIHGEPWATPYWMYRYFGHELATQGFLNLNIANRSNFSLHVNNQRPPKQSISIIWNYTGSNKKLLWQHVEGTSSAMNYWLWTRTSHVFYPRHDLKNK